MRLAVYLTIEELLYLHGRLIDEFGGQAGVRDLGLIDSALSRPRSGYYKSLSEQAASLIQSLCLNHCFIDGNKRVAFSALYIFLDMNGYKLNCKTKETEKLIIEKIIGKKFELDKITGWIEKRMVKKEK